MKDLRVGDRVKFLNDTGSGVVRKILDKDTVLVETEDGFDFPVLKEEVFLSVPAGSMEEKHDSQTDMRQEELQEESQEELQEEPQEVKGSFRKSGRELKYSEPVSSPENSPPEVFAGLVPREDCWELYIINDSQYMLWYWVTLRRDSLRYPAGRGVLEPDTKVLAGEIDPGEVFGPGKGIACFLYPFKEDWYYDTAPLEGLINPQDRNAGFAENEFFEEDALIVNLEPRVNHAREETPAEKLRKAPVTAEAFKDKPRVVVHKNKQATPATPEIDLHIQQLVDNPAGMSPWEILETQMARFHIAIEGAIKAGQKRIIFIHGLGAGKLKQQIRNTIDTEYSNCRYQDASFKEYGYGATMILIRH